ncbi:MAG: tRNA lysidine(34) synthetase TilS [Candidatus Neomarinimicrobiota bacterium]
MQNKILSNIESLIENEKPHFLLALSGGVDSMVMLDCFKKMSNQYEFSVCHVNHNYQENALLMEKLVSDSCGSNIKCIIKQISSSNITSNIESKFRDLRYKALEEARKEINADYIITAHHADDQAETILMKILNSSGFSGLEGIRKKNNNVLRPMIDISKEEIAEYANKQSVDYLDDFSNNDMSFTRNFLRSKVFPNLRKVKNNIHLPFLDFNNRVKEVNELIEYTENMFYESESFNKKKKLVQINRDIFLNLPLLVQLRVITKLCYQENSISKTDVRELKDFFRKNQIGSERKINELTIAIDRNDIIIFESFENTVYKEVLAGENIKDEDFTFSWNFDKKPKHFIGDSSTEFIDASNLSSALVIRSVKKDDQFLPLGMKDSKKVNKFLKDKKISSFKRNQSLVVCNNEEIVWVAGHQLSDKYKINQNSKKIAKLNFLRN